MKHILKKALCSLFPLLAAIVFLLPLAGAYAEDDEALSREYYFRLKGLDGRNGECDTSYDCAASPWGCYSGPESSGQVGVSDLQSYDKMIDMAGSVLPVYDDGREEACVRSSQVYTIVERVDDADPNQGYGAFPGLTNSMIGLMLPNLLPSDRCSTDAEKKKCTWSTQYAGPRPTVDIDGLLATPEADLEDAKNSLAIQFPLVLGDIMLVQAHAEATGGDLVKTRYMAMAANEDLGVNDLVYTTQYVYQPADKPYFDITWEIRTSSDRVGDYFTDFQFWHAMDTFTGGNDFGFGYLCDVTKIAGGTGGAAFFQGTIALHPSKYQYEGWWGRVFDFIRRDKLSLEDYFGTGITEQDWHNPLSSDMKDVVPLTSLEDNAIVHQWEVDEIGRDPKYISVRWTFDDPIRDSTYGTTRSLFAVSSDDMGYIDDGDTEQGTQPLLYDIYFNPAVWGGSVAATPMPRPCNSDDDCISYGTTLDCLKSPECKDTDDPSCPKYCAYSNNCGTDEYSDACDTDQSCVFGFCVDEYKWKRGAHPDDASQDTYEAERVIFTFNEVGQRIWFTATDSDAASLQSALGADSLKEAKDIIAWTRGEIYLGTDKSKTDAERLVIDDNTSNEVDLHKPLNQAAKDAGNTIVYLRERYFASEERKDGDTDDYYWLLGDVAHADPIYIGANPMNSWLKVDGDPLTPYESYINSKVYQKRTPVLLVAANDGMLHCYNAMSGKEEWAFIPWDIMPKIKEMAKPMYEQLRSPSLDLRPVVHDALDIGVNTWKTVLILGSRGGGNTYWAMDISPTNNGHLRPNEEDSIVDIDKQTRVKFMWYYNDVDPLTGQDDLGLTYSIPTTGRFSTVLDSSPDPKATQTKWLAMFGSGYAKHSAAQMRKEAYFYVVDLFANETDSTIPNYEYKPKLYSKVRIYGDGTNFPQMGTIGSAGKKLTNNVLSSPTVADWNFDGLQDGVYIGDLVGHLLKFEINAPIVGGASPETNPNIDSHVLFATYTMKPPDNPDANAMETLDSFKMVVENKRLGGTDTTQKYEFYKYPRPISTRPVIWRTTGENDTKDEFLGSEENKDKLMIFFGTGKYDSFYDSFDEFLRGGPGNPDCQGAWQSDIGNYSVDCVRDTQMMFGIVDRQETAPDDILVRYKDLVKNVVSDETKYGKQLRKIERGSTDPSEFPEGDAAQVPNGPDTLRGWSLDFASTFANNRGEKIITEPVVWEQQNMYQSISSQQKEWILFFTTFTPNMQGTCDIRHVNEAGGGFLMTVRAEDGFNPSFVIQDVNDDGVLDNLDQISDANTSGYAGQKFTGSILSRVDVDPYQKVVYVKTGPDNPVQRIQIAGLPSLKGAKTSIFRVVK